MRRHHAQLEKARGFPLPSVLEVAVRHAERRRRRAVRPRVRHQLQRTKFEQGTVVSLDRGQIDACEVVGLRKPHPGDRARRRPERSRTTCRPNGAFAPCGGRSRAVSIPSGPCTALDDRIPPVRRQEGGGLARHRALASRPEDEPLLAERDDVAVLELDARPLPPFTMTPFSESRSTTKTPDGPTITCACRRDTSGDGSWTSLCTRRPRTETPGFRRNSFTILSPSRSERRARVSTIVASGGSGGSSAGTLPNGGGGLMTFSTGWGGGENGGGALTTCSPGKGAGGAGGTGRTGGRGAGGAWGEGPSKAESGVSSSSSDRNASTNVASSEARPRDPVGLRRDVSRSRRDVS